MSLGQCYVRIGEVRWAQLHRFAGIANGKRGLIPYVASIALVLVAFFTRLAIAPLIGDRAPLLPFIAAVVLAAGLYGMGPGLLAIALSALLATSIFMTPVSGEFTPEQITNIVVFLITSGAMMLFAKHLRKARSHVEELELELTQAQANAAMSTMAATLAHELNQPLAAAANYVAACQQIASLAAEGPQSLVKGLQQAETQIQRAGDIIRQARALVRRAPLEREVSSLGHMFRRVIEAVQTSDGRGVEFEIDMAPDADSIMVNAVQIEQVLLNLVRNACQAMHGAARPKVQMKAVATARGSLIEVRDSGPGIPRDRLSALFSAGKSSGTGLGIGLSISRTIVEAHGGNIWGQNNPEGGASFFVLLPSRAGAI